MLELIGHWERGELSPYVSQTFPLDQASEALRVLADREAIGKVVVTDLRECLARRRRSWSNVGTREGRWSTRDW